MASFESKVASCWSIFPRTAKQISVSYDSKFPVFWWKKGLEECIFRKIPIITCCNIIIYDSKLISES